MAEDGVRSELFSAPITGEKAGNYPANGGNSSKKARNNVAQDDVRENRDGLGSGN